MTASSEGDDVSERSRVTGSAWRWLLLAVTIVPAVLALLLVLHATADTTPAGPHVLGELALTDSPSDGAGADAGLAPCTDACLPDDGLLGIGCALLLIILLVVSGAVLRAPLLQGARRAWTPLFPSPRRLAPSLLILSVSRT